MADADTPTTPLIQAKLPAYLAEAFEELYGEDGLLVLGRGMGIMQIIAAFVRFYVDDSVCGHVALVREEDNEKRRHLNNNNPPVHNDFQRHTIRPLVFVLGLKESECSVLLSQLESWGTPSNFLPTFITSESGQAQDRVAMYRRGGIFVVTSRILIVDILTRVVDVNEIECFLVAHAEKVSEQSTEAFILRIYKTQHGHRHPIEHESCKKSNFSTVTSAAGSVKAFSSEPADLLHGAFAKVDKVLKSLQVRRLYLYPRFHASVSDELEKCQPYVDEMHMQLTPLMKEIQGIIAAAVQTCIKELKKATAMIDWKDADVSVENCLSKNFDQAISRQLDQDWHKLKHSTRQLVNDLRTLRTLFQYLIEYDCVSFYKLLLNIQASSAASRNPSLWLLTPAADLLFRKAKERIYTIQKPRPTKRQKNQISVLSANLEESPKLRLLRTLLTEIKTEWEKNLVRKSYLSQRNRGGASILVMVKDKRTLDIVRSNLVEGKDRSMSLRWLNFLEKNNVSTRSVLKDAGDTSCISEESRLLLEEESRVRNFLFGNSAQMSGGKKRPFSVVPNWVKKKRKIAQEKNRGNTLYEKEDVQQRAVLDEAIANTDVAIDQCFNTEESGDNSDDSDDEIDELFKVEPLHDLRIVFRTYADTEEVGSSMLLEDINPGFVVLFDADPSFIRSLEIHANAMSSTEGPEKNKKDRLRVYFMLFEASAEERQFLKLLEREQNAFERLINHKRTMPLPITMLGGTTQEMMQATGKVGSYASGALPLSVDTRRGRGVSRSDKERRIIVVDVREFRSALPSILHQQEMRLAPVTLTVGDFVLSPVHCVERKSISDLFGSFASGRLHTQAEAMSKHYKCPCLLIEFDPEKSFSLQNVNELGSDIKQDSICSKMALLMMHFPRLRILWSRSPYETVKIFKSLKVNHGEPDVEKAVEIGSNESIDNLIIGGGEVTDEDEINEAARDMLLRLPGINRNNARKIIDRCDSIAELAEMNRDDLKELLGPLSGQKLFTFFRKKIAAT
mmetsp:Transcript_27057/g.41973  ORF Transcript_27057/g.41973 Transcript_27057/m.41973 type:complete len:1016 (+) Transcript_27057:13-3060(+)